jgi:transcriptional regulator of heat shock response
MEDMTSRQKALLLALVERYIAKPIPVSSRLLEDSGIADIRSAMIRAELHALEELGYLQQLHTSGGRIPTERAYRYFVDTCIEDEEHSLDAKSKLALLKALESITERNFQKQFAHLLSDIAESPVVIGNDDEVFYKAGISRVMTEDQESNIQDMERVAMLLDNFEDFIHVWRPSELQDVSVYIGKENPVGLVKKEALIVGTYNWNDREYLVAFVGPLRMNYKKHLAILKFINDFIDNSYGK